MPDRDNLYNIKRGYDAVLADVYVDNLYINGNQVAGGLLLGSGEVVDLNGEADALVLDAAGTTSISAPTDNQIDIEVNGADDFRITANTFTALSGSVIATDTISETTSAAGVTVDGALIKDGTVPTREVVTLASSDAAIAVKDGTVVITKSSAAALTLAAPSAGTDDGKVLTVVAGTAHAHTITQTTPGFNSGGTGSDVATFGGAIGDAIRLVAYNGVWITLSTRNVTLA